MIIALPVAPKETVNNLLKKEADQVEVVTRPSSLFFNSVGQYYQSFEPVSDEKVIEVMKNRSCKHTVSQLALFVSLNNSFHIISAALILSSYNRYIL